MPHPSKATTVLVLGLEKMTMVQRLRAIRAGESREKNKLEERRKVEGRKLWVTNPVELRGKPNCDGDVKFCLLESPPPKPTVTKIHLQKLSKTKQQKLTNKKAQTV